ncbi:hypothetical protein ACJX0J_041345 [Zea mays]
MLSKPVLFKTTFKTTLGGYLYLQNKKTKELYKPFTVSICFLVLFHFGGAPKKGHKHVGLMRATSVGLEGFVGAIKCAHLLIIKIQIILAFNGDTGVPCVFGIKKELLRNMIWVNLNTQLKQLEFEEFNFKHARDFEPDLPMIIIYYLFLFLLFYCNMHFFIVDLKQFLDKKPNKNKD